MANEKLIDITGLSRYHENLKTEVLSKKQDVITDLEDIRSKANDAAGDAATAEQNAKDYADGLAGNYDAAGAAAAAKDAAIADAAEKYQVKGDYEAAGAADQALADAKTYVDGKVDGKFDAAGTADQALADAKTYVDGKVDGKFDAAGTAAGLNTAMDARVKVLEEIDHEQLAADASAAAVATILDGAPEKFDTLKEVAEWISATDSAASAADLVTRVVALEAIDHDAYVDADATVLTDAKSYVDGKVDGKFDAAGAAAGAAAQALADAKADAAEKYQVKGDYEAAGAAAQALADAKADAALLYQVKIDGLETIRSGAAAGATALQANDLVFATDDDIDGLFEIQ